MSEQLHNVTYQQTCQTCKTVTQYKKDAVVLCDWYENGYITCPTCKQPLAHDETYALNVPAVVEPSSKKAFCTQCGTQLIDGATFCTNCSKQVGASQNMISAQQSTTQEQNLPFILTLPQEVPMPPTADPMQYTVPSTYDPAKYDYIELPELEEKAEKKLLGIQGMFAKGQKRDELLTSRLLDQVIKDSAKEGKKYSREEADKIRFARDPIFKRKVIETVHSDCDKEYHQNIKRLRKEISSLENAKQKEIARVEESRWTYVADKMLRYNLTEGKVLINDTPFLFSSIKGAGANIHESYRVVTEETGKSKKRGSVGGAVVGGLMFGAVGAVVGGTALGKTTHQSTTNVNNIPTASHVGVIVNIDGFQHEILVLNKTVDQESKEFQEALQKTQNIISALQYLTTIPVPRTYLKAEHEQSVLQIHQRIYDAKNELNAAIENVPTYAIPEKYL